MNNDRQITISTAGSRRSTSWPASVIWWSDLAAKLSVPVRSTETLDDYMHLPKGQQDDLKDVGGFVGGKLKDGRRNGASVQSRDIVTLDLDNIPAGETDAVLAKVEGLGCDAIVYSTRKHSPGKPRLRVLALLDSAVGPEAYEAIARKLAEMIGIQYADPTTFQPFRLMYWPNCCADSEYVYKVYDKPLLSAAGMLNLYEDWHDVSQWPQVQGEGDVPRKLAAKQGDPASKSGLVGAFCRQYDVPTALDKWLPGVYTETNRDNRLTYTAGSTTGGAIIYDEGKFLYSHHATDPCSGRLVNSWDLVRLHKFGDQDKDAQPGTPTSRMPSSTAMREWVTQLPEIIESLQEERRQEALEAFGVSAQFDPATAAGTPEILPAETDSVPHPTLASLDVSTATGEAKSTLDNVVRALDGDGLLRDRIMMDDFAARIVAVGPLPWNQEPGRRQWSDSDDAGLILYLERVYKLKVAQAKAAMGILLTAERHKFNAVTEMLDGLAWDGTPRVETLLIDYLGAEDSTYTRAVARKAMAAAVGRAYAPGIKWDYMPILVGRQGIGKSTLTRTLAGEWFCDSLTTLDGKDPVEQIQGSWICELAELESFNRSEINTVKGFISRQVDKVRLPYARRSDEMPRRCTFWGTTNEEEFLRDATGERRFWPVTCEKQAPTKNVFTDLPSERDQILAEAVQLWENCEQLYLTGGAYEQWVQATAEHKVTDSREGLIRDWLAIGVPEDWDSWSVQRRRIYWGNREAGDPQEFRTVPRSKVCAREIAIELLSMDGARINQRDTRELNQVLKSVIGAEGSMLSRFGPYGKQRGFNLEGWHRCGTV